MVLTLNCFQTEQSPRPEELDHDSSSSSEDSSSSGAPPSPRSHWGQICSLPPDRLKEYITAHGSNYDDCADRAALIRRAHHASNPIRQLPPTRPASDISDRSSQPSGCPVALELGNSIYAGNEFGGRRGRISHRMIEAVGGRDGFVAIFEEFYVSITFQSRLLTLLLAHSAASAACCCRCATYSLCCCFAESNVCRSTHGPSLWLAQNTWRKDLRRERRASDSRTWKETRHLYHGAEWTE